MPWAAVVGLNHQAGIVLVLQGLLGFGRFPGTTAYEHNEQTAVSIDIAHG